MDAVLPERTRAYQDHHLDSTGDLPRAVTDTR